MDSSTLEKRSQLRQLARKRRQSLTPAQRKKYSTLLQNHLLTLSLFINAKHIALYIPNDGEIDPTGIINAGEKMGKSFYLPILPPEFGLPNTSALWFGKFSPKGSAMVLNKFNIPEPALRSPRHRIKSQALDLILLPLVCFDLSGNRLGMGGGYYDRTLARHYRTHPKCIGVAFEAQKFDALPVCSWDIPLHGIVTEKRQYLIQHNPATP